MKKQILDTDYTNYFVEGRCFDNINFALEDKNTLEPVHKLTVNIFTRKPERDTALLKEIEAKLSKQISDKIDLQTISHSGCQYRDF